MATRYSIKKKFRFESAHRLLGLPVGHKCSRIHGHSYKVEVELSSAHLDETGMVVDFADVSTTVGDVLRVFDHRIFLWDKDPLAKVLGGVPEDMGVLTISFNPTAENLAAIFWDYLVIEFPGGDFGAGSQEAEVRLDAVTVWETETSSATVRR